MSNSNDFSLSDAIQCISGQADTRTLERMRHKLAEFDQGDSGPPASIPMGSDASTTQQGYWARPRSGRTRPHSISRVFRSRSLRIAMATSILLTLMFFGNAMWRSQAAAIKAAEIQIQDLNSKIHELKRLNQATADHYDLLASQALAKLEEILNDRTLDRAVDEKYEAIENLLSYEQPQSSGSWQALDPSEVDRRKQNVITKTREAAQARDQRAAALRQVGNLLKSRPQAYMHKYLSYKDLISK
jgi:hypothetical protein